MNNKILIMGLFSFLTAFNSCNDTYDFKSVEVDEFATVIQDSTVVLLDVRTAEEYAESHIAHALNLDATQVNFSEEAIQTLPKDRTIAVYCRSGRRSKKAANELTKAGFQVVELNKGFNCWTNAQKSIEKGTEEVL